MTLQDFDVYASEKGYRLVASTMYGVYDGYPFGAVIRIVNKKTASLNTEITTGSIIDRKLLKELKQLLPRGSQVLAKNKNSFWMNLTGKDGTLFPAFEAGLAAVTARLHQMGIYPGEQCVICGQPGFDGYMAYQGDFSPVHIACGEHVCDSAQNALAENMEKGSYGKAALFALAGAFVGAIPTFLLLVLSHYIAALLCALIPIASSWAYNKANGKRTGTGVFIICICSLFMGLVLGVAFTYTEFITYLDIWPSVIDVIRYMIGEPAEYGRVGQILLFVGLGVVFSYSYISKTAYSLGNGVEIMRDTITEREKEN